MSRTDEREISSTVYPPGYIERILSRLEIGIRHTQTDQVNALCPFHQDSAPSFTVNTTSGLYYCFAASCAQTGTIQDLIQRIKGYNPFEAMRFMKKVELDPQESFMSELEFLIKSEELFEAFPHSVLNDLEDGLGDRAIEYMVGRGISLETLKAFKVGYSAKKDMVALPLHSHDGTPVGIVGRSIEGKRFQYSNNTPIAKVWFNLNRARKISSTAIIVEASFDALKVHEAGFPNVVAILGGSVSPYKMDLLNKYFDRIIIMTDNDPIKFHPKCLNHKCKGSGRCLGHNAGREAGESIANRFKREVLWAVYDDDNIYPNGAKDPGEMTKSEISVTINNAITDYEYKQLVSENS